MNTASDTPCELLAPAGDADCLRAAIVNGADAVYFGLPRFSARARATNFSPDDLPAVLRDLHDHNVRGYVAFNTLIFPEEVPAAVDYIRRLAEAGADAVIVQDLGLARLIRQMAPDLPIHASTQMTVTDARSSVFAAGLGVSRVILAREMSVEQIAAVAGAGPEVEVFVHGALCVSYSGQCLASQWLFGRSGNRGQCAQACRLPYTLIVDGESADAPPFPLSPRDLAGESRIGALAEAGVAALKVEGRLKSPHYVAAACQAVRAAMDAADDGRSWRADEATLRNLEQGFSREFCDGFLDGPAPGRLVGGRYPNSRGAWIGTVDRVGNHVCVTLADGVTADLLKPGDGVLFDAGDEADNQGGRVYEVFPGGAGKVELGLGNEVIDRGRIRRGQGVWKTDDPAVRKRLEQSWSRDVVPHPSTVDATVTAEPGRPTRLELRDAAGNAAVVESDAPAEVARKRPPTVGMLREQLSRLGGTPFVLGEVTLVPPDSNAMIPKSVLNELRRRAATELADVRHARTVRAIADADPLTSLRAARPSVATPNAPGRRPGGVSDSTSGDVSVAVSVLIRSLEQLAPVLDFAAANAGRVETVYVDVPDDTERGAAMDAVRSAGLAAGLATPRICQQPADEDALAAIAERRPDRVLVRNLSAVKYFAGRDLTTVGDAYLNVANDLSADVLLDAGLSRWTPSLDLSGEQIVAIAAQAGGGALEPVVYLHTPLMATAHCLFAANLGGGRSAPECGRPCARHRLALRDRKGMDHPVEPDAACRNTLYAGRARHTLTDIPAFEAVGVRHVRVEFLHESPESVAQVLAML